jgi:hypothetical protein
MTTDTTTPPAKTPAPEPAKKRGGLGKWLLYIGGVIVLLILIAVAVFYFCIDGFIRGKVVDTAQLSTKQKAELEAATLKTLAGNLTLSKLIIGNPTGYTSPNLVDMGSCSVDVDTGSLMTNTIKIPEIHIDGLSVYIEQNGLNNNLIDVINTITAQKSDAAASSGKDLDIGRIRLTNTKLVLKLPIIPGFENQTYTLDEIIIDKPLDPNGRTPKLIDVFLNVLVQMLQQTAHNPKIAGPIQDLMKKHLGNLDKMLPKDFLNKMPDLKNLGKNVPTQPGDILKGLNFK